jgi:hypothetical protein
MPAQGRQFAPSQVSECRQEYQSTPPVAASLGDLEYLTQFEHWSFR